MMEERVGGVGGEAVPVVREEGEGGEVRTEGDGASVSDVELTDDQVCFLH